jgi:murein DD-endopeptidase MepM/ murein hydrolase activator NlpD
MLENPLNQLMPQFQQLNKLWNETTASTEIQPVSMFNEQTARPQQNSYSDYANQFPMMAQPDNPYGSYAALRSRTAAQQAPLPEVPTNMGAPTNTGGGTNLKNFKVTSGYGGRKDPITGKQSNHNGIDIGTPANTKLTSPVDGVVVETRNSSSWGNTIVIRDSAGNLHRYAHMNGFNVKPGQKVSRGSYVGLSGNTGRSTGAHLHYEVTNAKGGSINPSMFL